MRYRYPIALVILLMGLLSTATTAEARSFWSETGDTDLLKLEILHPALDYLNDLTIMSNVFYLSGRYAVGGGMCLAWELPYARWSFEDADETESAIGNFYLGVEDVDAESVTLFDLGVRLPTAPEDEAVVYLGAYSDWVDRLEAFRPEIVSVTVGTTFRAVSRDATSFSLRLAPTLWHDAGDDDDSTEFFVLYGARYSFETASSSVGMGFSGRLWLSATNGDFSERTFHQLGFFANLRTGRWRPGFQVRVPMDEDMRRIVDPIFSISLGVVTD